MWENNETDKTYTRNWKLIEKGTSYTKEFAAFLKGIYRHTFLDGYHNK